MPVKTRSKLSTNERAEIASRISELVTVKYFRQIQATRFTAPTIRRINTMLARMSLDVSDFDTEALAPLLKHRNTICLTKPKCKSCPLVSFCKFGAERVKQDRKPIVVDLFGGSGGMGSGFRSAGFRVGLAVEIDRDAAQTYRINNPGVVVKEWDVAKLTSRKVRNIIGATPTAICAGPPCQSFSAAGLRRSRDPRHHLFKHVVEIARQLTPDFVVIENVPGINRVVGRRNFFGIIKSELLKHFNTEVFLLKATDFGVAQARKRYFFVGWHRSIRSFTPPRPTHRPIGSVGSKPATPTVVEVLRRLPRRKHGQYQDWCLIKGRVIWNVGTMFHSDRVIRKISRIRGSEAHLSYRRLSRQYASTIIAGHRALPVHPTMHRTISVKEAALIQGFDIDYVFMGARSNQPLQVANAVPPPLAAALAKQILSALRQ